MNGNSLLFRARGIYHSLLKKGIPFHLNEKNEPFFIVGSGRCGTTLLRRILNTGSNIYIPPENWALSKVIFKFRRLRTQMNWDTLVDLTVAAHCQDTQGWFDSFPSNFVENMRNLPEKEQSLHRLIDRLYIYHAQLTGTSCERWGDKTPLNINHMELILSVFPKAKFIHMIRDGVDVVHSLQNLKDHESLTTPAKTWQSAIHSAEKFRKKHPENILESHYEDLVRTPSQTVKNICSYLNISFDESFLKVKEQNIPDDLEKKNHYKNVLRPISDKHIGKGRRNFSSQDKRILKHEINDDLIKLGYEPLETTI